jgi:hypothetical protein
MQPLLSVRCFDFPMAFSSREVRGGVVVVGQASQQRWKISYSQCGFRIRRSQGRLDLNVLTVVELSLMNII